MSVLCQTPAVHEREGCFGHCLLQVGIRRYCVRLSMQLLVHSVYCFTYAILTCMQS